MYCPQRLRFNWSKMQTMPSRSRIQQRHQAMRLQGPMCPPKTTQRQQHLRMPSRSKGKQESLERIRKLMRLPIKPPIVERKILCGLPSWNLIRSQGTSMLSLPRRICQRYQQPRLRSRTLMIKSIHLLSYFLLTFFCFQQFSKWSQKIFKFLLWKSKKILINYWMIHPIDQ